MVEAAPLVEGSLRANLTLLLPRFPANPFLEVLWPILRVDAVAMRRVGLLPGALHVWRSMRVSSESGRNVLCRALGAFPEIMLSRWKHYSVE